MVSNSKSLKILEVGAPLRNHFTLFTCCFPMIFFAPEDLGSCETECVHFIQKSFNPKSLAGNIGINILFLRNSSTSMRALSTE